MKRDRGKYGGEFLSVFLCCGKGELFLLFVLNMCKKWIVVFTFNTCITVEVGTTKKHVLLQFLFTKMDYFDGKTLTNESLCNRN